MISLRRRLSELRRTFLDTPRSHLRIALMLEDKKMSRHDLLELCEKFGKSRDTVERQIRYMLADKVLGETPDGMLYLHNPHRYYYIVLYGKGSVLSRWFALLIPVGVLALLFSSISVAVCQVLIGFALVITVGLFVEMWLRRIF